MKPDLHELALSIFRLALRYTIDLQVDWVPRSLNVPADSISRFIDCDDWSVSIYFFNHWTVSGVPILWIGLLANSHNSKLTRFYSRYWNPGCEGVDAFCYDWVGENNWLVPPVSLVPRVIWHLSHCKAVGTLIVPEWVSSPFLAYALWDRVPLPFPC